MIRAAKRRQTMADIRVRRRKEGRCVHCGHSLPEGYERVACLGCRLARAQADQARRERKAQEARP